MSKFWPATDLTGGIFGALDAIDGALILDGDAALVMVPGGSVYHYTVDAASGAAESSPDVIAPDANAGTKRWILTGLYLGGVNHIQFLANPVGVPVTEATVAYNQETKTLTVKTDIADALLNVGTEDWVRIKNNTGADIPDGSTVVGSGIFGQIFEVALALAVPGPLASITGITTTLILDGAEGWAVTRGDVRNYDTSGFAAMDVLYASATVAGTLTNIPPTPPNYAIPLGYAKDSAVDGRIYVFADNPIALIQATDAAVASGDPTGWHAGDNILVEYDKVARTITLTGDLKYSWRGQVKELTSPWVSDPHPDILDDEYYLFSNDGINFGWSTTEWGFSDIQVAMAWYFTNDQGGAREAHGLMPWQAHEEFHRTISTYRDSGGTLSDYVLSSTTPADRRPVVSTTVVKDEDCRTTLPALSSSLYTKSFLTGAGLSNFTVETADIVPLSGANPYYNQFVSPNWVQTLMPNNSYMSVWLVAVPVTADADSQKYRYIWFQGQSAGSLADQEALFPSDLNLGSFGDNFDEDVFLAKLILRYTSGDWRINKVELLTGTRASTIGSPAGVYLSTVEHDATLTGAGTVGDPLAVLAKTPAGGGAGDSIIKASATDYDFTILKNNLAAVVAPAITNDSSEGYATHSRWTDLATAKVYECVDASIGAAVWVDLTGGGASGEWTETGRVLVTTAQSFVDVLDCFSDTYTRYRARVVRMKGFSAAAQVYFRLGYGVGPTWVSSAYDYHTVNTFSGSGTYQSSFASESIYLRLGSQLGITREGFATMEMMNLRDLTRVSLFTWQGSGYALDITNCVNFSGIGSLTYAANKLEHFRMFPATGTISDALIIIEGAN